MTAAEPIAYFNHNTAPTQYPLDLATPPLRIALLGYRSHPFVGGQGIYLKYLSRALTALGHHVDVFSGPPYPELDNNVRLFEVPSLDLFAQASHIRALRPKHLLSWSDTVEWGSMLSGGFAEPYTFGRRVAKLIAPQDYDIVHDNQSLCTGLLDIQNRGARVVSTIHHPIHRDRDIALDAAAKWGDRLLVKRWYSFLRMQQRVVRQLQHVITVSQVSQNDIAHYFKRDINSVTVIPNGIDTATFRPLKEIERVPLRVMTTTSSDQPLKGLQHLLTAIAVLKTDFPGIHLRVIGQLKPEGSTEKNLQQLGLNKHVSFVSGISTAALVAEYAQASVVVCPSLYEGFGLPAGEAMASEVPVISTDGGALPEVVGDAGIVVPAGEGHAIAAQLRALFCDPNKAKELGKKGRQRILKQFSWHTVGQQLSQYYAGICHANHPV